MKKNSFNKLITLSVSLALIAPSVSFGGIKGVRTQGSTNTGTGSVGGSSGNTTGKVDGGKVTPIDDKTNPRDVNAGTVCSMDQDESKIFPINFLSQLTRDGSSPTLELRDNNKVMVKFPAIITSCGKVTIKPQQDPTYKNVTVMFAMEKDGTEQTYKEVIDCLSKPSAEGEEPMLKDGKINHDKIKAKNYAEYFYTFDYDFDKSKDVQKTLKLAVGFPKAFSGSDGYDTTFGKDPKIWLPDSACVVAEKISSDDTYINRGRDVLIEDIRNKCLTGKTDEILKARKSLGNADALKDIADVLRGKLDSAYLEAAKPEVDAIYKQMKDLETKMNKGTKDIDEKTAKGYITKYSELAKKLDDLYLNPAVYRLDGLMTKYTDSTDDAEKTKLNDEIKKLNTNIGKFAARDSVSMINLYGLMEKFSTNDEAKLIEDVRLRSSLYAKVYPDSDTKDRGYTIESANQKQITTLKKFDRILTDWSDIYLAGHGSTAPLLKVNKEMQAINTSAINHANKFQQDEIKNYDQYCGQGFTGGVKNPIQCNVFMQGRTQRANLEKRRIDAAAAQVNTRRAKLDKMSGKYNEYEKARQEKASQDGDSTPYGNGYFTADGSFDELNPPYEVSSTPMAYNPNTYQMGVPNQFNAYQPAPQYMQAPQQGQYQMYPMRQ